MKFLLIIPLILLLLVISIAVLLPISIFNPDAYQANKFLEGEGDYIALKFFQSAEKGWPFLKFNLDFQNKYKRAEIAQEEYLKSHPALIIFPKENISDTEINDLVDTLKKLDNVTKVKYVTKEEALQIYRDKNQDNPQLLELITVDILQDSIEIFLEDWEKNLEIRNLIENNPIVADSIMQSKPF